MPPLSCPGPDFESDAELLACLDVAPTEEQLGVVAEIGRMELAELNAPEPTPGPWTAAERLADRARVSEALTRKAQAHMLRDVDALVAQLLADDLAVTGRERSEAMEFAVDEVAAALGVSRRTAEIRIDDAMTLVGELPRTVAALEAGLISFPVARVLAAEIRLVPLEVRGQVSAEVESRVLDRVGRGELDGLGRMSIEQILLTPVLRSMQAWRVGLGLTAERVRRLARTTVAELSAALVQPEPVVVCGDLDAYPMAPGIMYLGGPMLEGDGVVALARIEAMARWLKTQPGETRGMGELRLQAYRDLLVGRGHGAGPGAAPEAGPGEDPGGPGAPSPVPFDVRLTVDGTGLASAPRYGLLSPHVLEQVLAQADAVGGTVLVTRIEAPECPGAHDGADPGPYRPSDRLAASVRMRERTCRFPGCTVPAGRCDLDHTLPWPHGPTCSCNLSCLCRHHHRLKTHGRWRVVNHGDGRLTWTTPSGRTIECWPDP
jgi:hypothetical protein